VSKQQYPSEYAAWTNAKQRCSNPRNRAWCNYGGRGIKVCRRWRGPYDFANFLKDMGPKPRPELTLERKNNDKGYTPSNCVWATRTTQMQNRRNSSPKLTFQGQTLTYQAWAKQIGVPWETIRWRHRQGYPIARVLCRDHGNATGRTGIQVTYRGKTCSLTHWAQELGFKYMCLLMRYYRGDRPPQLFRALRT
jgi:hypothetical protein